MGAVGLAGALADPDHMGRGVEPFAAGPVQARQGAFQIEQQGLVAGEHLDARQVRVALRRHADRFHEGQGLADLVGQFAIARAVGVVGGKPQRPAMDVIEVRIAAAGKGAQQVQRRGRLVIGLQQSLRIRDALGGRKAHAVDDVAAIAGQFDAIDHLDRGRAWLGELAGDTADLHHRLAPRKGQHDRHLQDQPEGIADIVGRELLEALCTVAALQQEGIARLDLGQAIGQAPRLAGKYQRRQGAQFVLDVGQGARVGVVHRHLHDGLCSPAIGCPALGHALKIERRCFPNNKPLQPFRRRQRRSWARNACCLAENPL